MQCYDVHETLYDNCDIHDPLVRGLGPRVGPIWQYSKNAFKNLSKSSSLLP